MGFCLSVASSGWKPDESSGMGQHVVHICLEDDVIAHTCED